ncbi:dTDP-4-amino-4,6-dideoxyglucose formyltransferase [Leclercia adecarboxylata]|uniref:dTDP-4-amino-4,6-dideoxyglucose formyltransferase n=1 Tax=Leclercia adecarboxylata TaxID=83655 RepID=UPI0021F1B3D8|nr:dTDP-4-amino-4,6-dideoxyglucose formyltransferase [Leclercia adecarboxylata]UYM55336.1 dTDP-4-amino-4,6-dideoxyglucose formyltransferase [Leclercia adecarboxylata]
MVTVSSFNCAPTILIISDNAELTGHVVTLLRNKSRLKNLSYSLYYSYNNRSPEAMIELGASYVDLKDETSVTKIIASADIVFSLHCKQIFPQSLVEAVTCINVHPGYNPYNRGWYPQVFSIMNGLPAGVTIHKMDDKVDHGPIIYQEKIQIQERDTSLEAYRKIIALEKKMLDDYLVNLVYGEYQVCLPIHEGNYNSITDFKNLRQIEPEHIGTMKEHINILRALSHGQFKNAYFIDSDGIKNYIKITITTE